MAGRENVRQHTRRTPSGGTTRVNQHSRKGRPRKPVVHPRHAWKLLKRAARHYRRKRRGLALAFGLLAMGEMTAWFTLRGSFFLLATLGVLAIAAASTAAALSGGESGRETGRRSSSGPSPAAGQRRRPRPSGGGKTTGGKQA